MKNLSTRQLSILFWIFCAVHLIIWTLGPTLFYGNPHMDTIESIAWGYQWEWGYNKHPPLAAWLNALFTIAGGTVGWPVYLFAQLAIVVTFWVVWKLANQITSPVLAFISVFLLEGISYYNFASPKINPNSLMTPLWALAILSFYYALTQKKLYQWILVGVTVGLSMLCKYQSVLIVVAMLIMMVSLKETRANFLSYKPYIAAAVALIIFLPNFIWIVQHDFVPFTYTTGELKSDQIALHYPWLRHIFYPILFTIEQAGPLIGFFILLIPFYKCERQQLSVSTFNRYFLIILGLGPFLITILFSVLSGARLYDRWAEPYFSLIGILALVLWLRPLTTAENFKKFLKLVAVVFILMWGARMGYVVIGPHINHKIKTDAQFPGRNIANQLTQIWHDTYHTPLKYIAGSHYLVAYITIYSLDQPVPYFEWNQSESAWIDENKLKKTGAVFAWNATPNNPHLPAEIAKRFPQAKELPLQYFSQLISAKATPVTIGVALLPPETDNHRP